MNSAPRFWPLAALILLPVAVLAVLATIGLKERRAALRAEAERLCNARSFAAEWIEAVNGKAERSPDVILYDDLPLPQAPDAGAAELEAAIAAKDEAALRSLMITESTGVKFTASGLPVRALAGWHLAQLTGLESDAAAVVHVVAGRAPSMLSRDIIERLAERFPQQAVEGQWRTEWIRNEARRAALRMAAPQYRPGYITPLQVVLLPPANSELTGLPNEVTRGRLLNDAPMVGLEEKQGMVAMVFPRFPGQARVLLEYELREAFHLMQGKTAHLLPAWAAVNIRMKPSSLAHFGMALRLAGLGDDIPEVLSALDMQHYIIETGAREEGWLLRDFHRLVWWAVALIGSALLTAVLGLWLVRRTLERERRLGELKSQFVSSVSHELRAPVGSMRLMADALASGKVSGPPADEFHRLMASEGARLSGLIENVLDFARIEQGRKQYAFADTDVAALVQDAVKVMTPAAEARGQKILTDLKPLPFVPQVDAAALQQALINLLDNALKFSPPGSEIRVGLSHDSSGKTWSLSVADDGPGIPASEHVRIFERFYRLGNELRRETTGTGIGLAIVKHVVEGHEGRVEVKSEVGKGSVFRMEFSVLGSQFSVSQLRTPSTESCASSTENGPPSTEH